MKIALLTYSTRSRGGVVHTTYLAEALAKKGHYVKIFALGPPFEFYRKVSVPYEIFKTDIVENEPLRERVKRFIDVYIENIKKMKEYTDFDIYHAQDCISGNALEHLREKGIIKNTVRTIHHFERYPDEEVNKCQKFAIIRAPHRLVVSKYWQRYLKRRFGVESDVIYNGLDASKFSLYIDGTKLRNELSLNNSFVFLSVGGIEPRKGSLYLLRAFYKVSKNIPNARLVIVCTKGIVNHDPYQKKFQKERKDLGLEDNVLLIQNLPDEKMPEIYRMSDVFVFPSLLEGWGLAPMEAQASGLPVIAFDLPSMRELLNKENALLVKKKDEDMLACAMIELAKNPELAKRLAEKGRLNALRYSWEKTADSVLKFYENIFESRYG
ncbi:MAG: MSMEG_0565 family glycosyltransferase [Thermoplasmata archaeon]